MIYFKRSLLLCLMVGLVACALMPAAPPTTPAPTLTPTLTWTPAPTLTPIPTQTPTLIPGQPLPNGNLARNWVLKFSDEFDGTTLDTTKWDTCYNWGCLIDSNNEMECYMPENVIVGEGMVRLMAEKRQVTCLNHSQQVTQGYASGMIQSNGHFDFSYGFVEARTRGTQGKGLWPALWTIPSDLSWPPEIDILEIIGHGPTVAHLTYHYTFGGVETGMGESYDGPDFSADWHTFGVYWQPDAIRWYIDGVERFHFTETKYITGVKMYVIANLAVGGNWPGAPSDSTVFPNYFDVDYYRVWQ